MAPVKPVTKKIDIPHCSNQPAVKTRSQSATLMKNELLKRKADESPLKRITTKRVAFNDLTNADGKENSKTQTKGSSKKKEVNITKLDSIGVQKSVKPLVVQKSVKPLLVQKSVKPLIVQKSVKPPEVKLHPGKTSVKKESILTKTLIPKLSIKENNQKHPLPIVPKANAVVKKTQSTSVIGPVNRRSLRKSSDLEKTSESLYVSALEALELEDKKIIVQKPKQIREPPAGVEDFDKENLEDLSSVSQYAMDIFEYLKKREKAFVIEDYLAKQKQLNCTMRALLIDWMVEVQENFELNHETLYLAVKLVDIYLSKAIISKDFLQLLGCASIFVASKYDERSPPLIEDFLYVCDNLYTAETLMKMEVKLLKAVGFCLGVPLSYRFLRRYARCIKCEMPLLTLARYILELTLMEYSLLNCSDSKLAAACLFLALKMKKNGTWTPTLEYYTGYKLEEFKDIVVNLNVMLHKSPKDNLAKIREKYSHEIFFKVAQTPLLEEISW